jgi:membrane protease YdiL (CAAX protease family)
MTQAYNLVIYSISYLLFFAMLLLSKIKRGIRLLDDTGIVINRVMLIVLHVAGVLLFAVISFYSFDQQLPVVVVGKVAAGSLQIIVIGFFVILAIVIAPMLAEKNCRQPGNRLSVSTSLSSRFIINYFFIRILFLAAYETWFRGYLLTDCIASWGIPVAILINISFYTLLHIVNGKNEMLGCIPFGLLLCILCTWTDAAWPAILIHIAFTVSYEVHLIKKINKPSISFI